MHGGFLFDMQTNVLSHIFLAHIEVSDALMTDVPPYAKKTA